MHEKIAARKTEFVEVSKEEAGEFLDANHLQGSPSGARWNFGLKLNDKLIAVIAFSLHQGNQINLTRMAFSLGLTVVGGANKLLKNSLDKLPVDMDLITFSNNQYSDGGVYSKIGFSFAGNLVPSYEWFYNKELINKRRCRKHNGSIRELIGEDLYNHKETEHQNMFRAGARCLYDAGYQRWVYKRPIELKAVA